MLTTVKQFDKHLEAVHVLKNYLIKMVDINFSLPSNITQIISNVTTVSLNSLKHTCTNKVPPVTIIYM